MNTSRRYLTLLLFVFVICKGFAQGEENPPTLEEVGFKNNSTHGRTLGVTIYPVSMIMNGNEFYDLHCKNPSTTGNIRFHFLASACIYYDTNNVPHFLSSYSLSTGQSVGFQHERDAQNGGANGVLGYGIYKVEFNWGQGIDTCLIEFDFGAYGDLNFVFYDDVNGGGPRVMYDWTSTCGERNITAANKYIKSWEVNWCGTTRPKNYGNFIYTAASNNTYTVLPQDYRWDCGEENYPNLPPDSNEVKQYGIGRLTFNLTIDKNIQTRVFSVNGEWYEAPMIISITPNCTLKINENKVFTVKYDSIYVQEPTWYNKFYVQGNAVLELKQNARMIFEQTNWLTLICNSKVIMGTGSQIIMQNGSRFCNRGATFYGGMIYVSGVVRAGCNTPNPCLDNFMQDSSIMFLEAGSELEIPDSTVYVFEGNGSALICKDSSTIKFGKGSKLIFKDGARISANNTKFMSYDSTEAWDGIFITGDSYDTLKNCTFENAENGVNIGSSGLRPGILTTTLITNCTFNNRTNTKFPNQIFVYGNNPTLISGCNTVSDLSEGFCKRNTA